jgi:flagellar motor switch protein FliM
MEQPQGRQLKAVLYQDGAPDRPRQALESAHRNFARDLGVQLSAFLRFGVVVKYEGAKECEFAHFISQRDPNRCAASITAPPLDSQLLLDLDNGLVYALIELMLGGKPGGGGSSGREPTEIEKHLIAILMRTITAELMRTWCTIAPVVFRFDGIAASSQLARLLSPTETMVAASFNLAVGEQSGALTVLTPVRAAGAFLASVERIGPVDEEDTSHEVRITGAMMDAQVRVDVWLDDVSMQLRDLIQLREGYVVKFGHPTERPFTCLLNGELGFTGQVVSTGRKRALLIQKETPTKPYGPAEI